MAWSSNCSRTLTCMISLTCRILRAPARTSLGRGALLPGMGGMRTVTVTTGTGTATAEMLGTGTATPEMPGTGTATAGTGTATAEMLLLAVGQA